MNRFTIKDIENLSGIKAHTWRIWEQRYSIAIPQRKDSNHRFYDSDNLKQILRISYLYHSGMKISKVAKLAPDEMNTLALSKFTQENQSEYYIKELLEASLDFDEQRFELNYTTALETLGVEQTILKIIYPYQQRIGMLWLTDHIVPAQEHFTSNLIRQKILLAIDELPRAVRNTKKQIVLFTPQDEQHEIPLLFVSYLLRKNGHHVIYLGKNIPLKALKDYSKHKPFTHLLFHFVTNLTNMKADDYVQQLSKTFPDKQMIMSGAQVRAVSNVPENLRLLKSMEAILSFIQKYNSDEAAK